MGKVISLIDKQREVIMVKDSFGHTMLVKKYCSKCSRLNSWVKLSEMANFWGCKNCDKVED